MSRGFLVYSRKAGSFDPALLPKIVAALGDVITRDIEEIGSTSTILRDAKDNQCDWIGVAGGDGTIESVAAEVVGTEIPLGIIPAGTFNNFARSLDLPLDPIEACQIVVAGNVRAVDVGFANGHPFFECLGSGLDAALYPVTEEIKSGQLSRILELLRRAYWFRRPIFSLTLDRPICDALVHVANNESRHLFQALARNRTSSILLSASDDHGVQRPVLRDELRGRAARTNGRRVFNRIGVQPLQQAPALVALRLDRVCPP